jgi:glycogen debranching enzyme
MTGSPLDPAAAPVASAEGAGLTLVSGTTFCLSHRGGDITGPAQGLFARDTRIVSRLRLEVDGRSPETLAVVESKPDSAVTVSRVHPPPGRHDSLVLLERRRRIGRSLSETIVLRNVSVETMTAAVRLEVRTDFADLFAVKDGRARQEDYLVRPQPLPIPDGAPSAEIVPRLAFGAAAPGTTAVPGSPGLVVAADGAPSLANGTLQWDVTLAARSTWSVRVEFRPEFALDEATTAAQDRTEAWLDPATSADDVAGGVSRVTSTNARLGAVLRQSAVDLRSLELHLPGAAMPALAAGAPWFMTLFGRDSLIAGYMALPLHPAVLTGALETLAALQGRTYDAATEEQPGRILHELRLGNDSAKAIGGRCYYGTVDATPLFVMMLAEAWRWGADPAVIAKLLPAADAALHWCRQDGDRDGDGFIDYMRMNPNGLINQGWKDSFDGISDAVGRMPTYPVALCEVQAYHYRALLDRAELAEAGAGGTGPDDETAERLRTQAAALRERFSARFWLPERGFPALALDATPYPLDALASNAAHCLWGGLLDDEQAETVVAALAGADMGNGWGLRTLSTEMAAYNPMSYHNGSVWPHDTALAVAGLAEYAHVPGALALAHRLANGLLDAATCFAGRLPELLCGFSREEYPVPVPYPTSCSPQAWASAAPLLLVRSLLGLRPAAPANTLRLDPRLPPEWGTVAITGLELGDTTLTVEACGTAGTVTGLPTGWELVAPGHRVDTFAGSDRRVRDRRSQA